MIESSFGEKRVTSTNPEPDRNIQSGMIIHPAETLLVLCLLAQRPSRPDTELYVPARPTPAAWKSGERTCDSVTAVGARARKAADWQKTLIGGSEPFACRSRYAAAQATAHSAGTL